jgi:hypothetical protein
MPKVKVIRPDNMQGGFFENLSPPTRGVGKQQLLPKLAASLRDLPFLLCGPPGCGKKSMLTIAAEDAYLNLGIYDLGQISNEERTKQHLLVRVVYEFGGRQERNMINGKKTLLALYGAEHLDNEGAAFVRKFNVVLISTERTDPLKRQFGDRMLWVKRLTNPEMKHFVNNQFPDASHDQIQRATQLAHGDMRQAQFHMTFLMNLSTSSVDAARHVFFDVQDALCKGATKELDYHCRRWTSENHLLVGKTIDEHAAFSEELTTAALIEDPEFEHDAPNCIGNTADVVTGLAVRKLVGYKRVHFALRDPTVVESQRAVNCNYYKYPEINNDLRKYFAQLEGTAEEGTAKLCDAISWKRHRYVGAPSEPPQSDPFTDQSAKSEAAVTPESSSQAASSTDAVILLECKKFCIKSTAPFQTATDKELDTMACGPPVQNTRNRSEVIVECTDEDLRANYNKLKREGVFGVVVAKFRNGIAALVIKDKTKELKFNGTVRALAQGRRSNETVIALTRLFTTAAKSYGNIALAKKSADNEMPDFEDACNELSGVDTASFRAIHANALKARKYDRMTPLQEAVVTYTADLKDWLACKEDAESMIFNMSSSGPHFLNNFKREMILQLTGIHYEPGGGILKTTLKDVISKQQTPTKPPLCYSKTMIFVGRASTGKSEFVHGLCREFCQRHGKDKYGMSGSIDPYGLMTKSGKMKELGAIGLYDFELKSKINNRLSCEESKNLLYVKERAHIGARYHQAVFYEYVPRLWAINMGRDENGEEDPSEWFRTEHLQGLVHLVHEDLEGLNNGSEHNKAIARRAIIFIIDECLFERDAQGATDAAAVRFWEEGKINATPLE